MKVKETSPVYATCKKSYTYQDYIDLPQDDKRYEILNGELNMVPAPSTYHQDVSGNLEFAIRKFLEANPLGKFYDAPVDVVLSEEIVIQPDLLFIRYENSKIITEKNISGALDLVVEILSPASAYYDLIEKKEIYEQFGVQEYWIVDPKKQWVEIYENSKNKFELDQRLEKTGTLKSPLFESFQISLPEIFDTN
ncbi:MAG: Uma2 family endonuclease [bacterium]